MTNVKKDPKFLNLESWKSCHKFMKLPYGRRIDLANVAKKIFNIEPMPKGAIPVYYTEPKKIITR